MTKANVDQTNKPGLVEKRSKQIKTAANKQLNQQRMIMSKQTKKQTNKQTNEK